MNDSGGQEPRQENTLGQRWISFIFVVVLSAVLVSVSVWLAKGALAFSSLWMRVPFLALAGFTICLAALPVILLLRRKWETGRFFLTRAERVRQFEKRLDKLAAGEPLHSRAWYLIAPAIVLAVLLCIAIPAIAWMYTSGFGQSSPHERTFLWVLIAIIFVFPAMLMYKPIMRGLRPGSYRLTEEEVNRIRLRMRNPQPLRQRIWMANQMSIIAGIFTSNLIVDHIRNRPPNALWWGFTALMWVVAAISIWQVFRPSKPLTATAEPSEEPQKESKKSFKLIALGLILPLALASIFPVCLIHSIHPYRAIYPAATQARADLATALQSAAQSHKRILVEFGANSDPDSQRLDQYFHDKNNLHIQESSFIPVFVNTDATNRGYCACDANRVLASQYSISFDKGIPALAVLSEKGELIYSQKNGEFADMRHLKSSDLTEFLQRWKP
jgi:hypothetical protein